MENNRMSIVGLVKAFEGAFDYVNDRFYDGLLKRPVITIAEGAKVRAYGWVTTAEVWHEGEASAHELNIASDYLKRDFTEIVRTLLHECVHLENIREGVQDCARGGSRHNKKFAECAEKHGLYWKKPETPEEEEHYKKAGYSDVRLLPELEEEVYAALEGLKAALTMYRDVSVKGEKKKAQQKVYKYECPLCGCSCRATKSLALKCLDCDEIMEEV